MSGSSPYPFVSSTCAWCDVDLEFAGVVYPIFNNVPTCSGSCRDRLVGALVEIAKERRSAVRRHERVMEGYEGKG